MICSEWRPTRGGWSTGRASRSTIEAAANAAGIFSRTIRRYQKRPAFQLAYSEARKGALSHAISELHQSASLAVRVLSELAADEAVRPADRVRASATILDHAVKSAELVDFQERLTRLEGESGTLQ